MDWMDLITGCTNASPIVLTFPYPHGRTTGDTVWVRNVQGCWSANGVWQITVINDYSFSLNGSTGNGDWAQLGSAGTGVAPFNITSVTAEGCDVDDDACMGPTVIWSPAHGLADGNGVIFANMGIPEYLESGVYIVSVVDQDRFKIQTNGISRVWLNGLDRCNPGNWWRVT